MIDQKRYRNDLNSESTKELKETIYRFVAWLRGYGETSFDHQSFYAGGLGGKAKALYYKNPLIGTIAVAPMVFFEAFLPQARRLFWRRLRFPIADAHYAMGFSYLSQATGDLAYHDTAVHFLTALEKTRSPGHTYHCWGYPFDWVTRNGTIPANTPFITTLPYAFEAFESVYRIDKNMRWLEIMRSIAEHAQHDIKDFEYSPGAFSCGYGPYDEKGGVVNASAYRAFLLTAAGLQFADHRYLHAAEGNLNFVLKAQQPDGSWPYAVDGERGFVDHFHTCFVLKALAKIERLTGHNGCGKAIDRGIEYYLGHLIDKDGFPKPFSVAPRLTVYRRELYDYAECINLCVLLRERIDVLRKTLNTVVDDILTRWVKKDGSFRSRELLVGWDNVPMHRWAQSQTFRSLSFLLSQDLASTGHVNVRDNEAWVLNS